MLRGPKYKKFRKTPPTLHMTEKDIERRVDAAIGNVRRQVYQIKEYMNQLVPIIETGANPHTYEVVVQAISPTGKHKVTLNVSKMLWDEGPRYREMALDKLKITYWKSLLEKAMTI